MKLTKVQIKNFRCFESLDVPLQPDVNVFVGANGAGKSAILDGMAVALYHVVAACSETRHRNTVYHQTALQKEDLFLESPSPLSLEPKDHFIEFSAVATWKELSTVLEQQSPNDRLAWTDRKVFSELRGFQSEKNEGIPDLYTAFETFVRQRKEGEKTSLHLFPMVSYYRSSRRVEKSITLKNPFDFRFNPLEAFANALNAGGNFDAMIQWFYMRENSELRHELQFTENKPFEFPDLKAIRESLKKSIEGLEKIFFKDNPPTLMAEIRTGLSGYSKSLTLDQLSDGYRNLLGIIMDFARRMAQANPEAENPLEAPGILLIDEIELHLHPRWQQTIIPRLREVFPNTQIITATHSPQVLTTVESRCIHILRDQKIYAAPPGSYGAESKRMLERVLGAESRPPASENRFVRELRELFDLINREEYETAKTKLESLLEKTGVEDPALVEAQTMIENRLWEKELGI
jgi:predicted ATP-binding protein involved in virulence